MGQTSRLQSRCVEGQARVNDGVGRLKDLEFLDTAHTPVQMDYPGHHSFVLCQEACKVGNCWRDLLLGASRELAQAVVRGGEQAAEIVWARGRLQTQANNEVGGLHKVLHLSS